MRAYVLCIKQHGVGGVAAALNIEGRPVHYTKSIRLGMNELFANRWADARVPGLQELC